MPGLTVYFKNKVNRELDRLAEEAEAAGEEKNTPTLIAADIVGKFIDLYKLQKAEERTE